MTTQTLSETLLSNPGDFTWNKLKFTRFAMSYGFYWEHSNKDKDVLIRIFKDVTFEKDDSKFNVRFMSRAFDDDTFSNSVDTAWLDMVKSMRKEFDRAKAVEPMLNMMLGVD